VVGWFVEGGKKYWRALTAGPTKWGPKGEIKIEWKNEMRGMAIYPLEKPSDKKD
jgi:hypothetical protein